MKLFKPAAVIIFRANGLILSGFICAVVLLLVVGVLQTAQSQSSAPKVKACDLLTKEEVEEIIAEKIDSVEVQSGWGNCLFHQKVDIFGNIMNVPVVTVGYTKSDVQGRWDYWSSVSDKEIITGVGDGAIWSPSYDFFVCRIKGGLLMISVGGSHNDEEKKSMAIRLAKKAIPRIKP